jgi:hypothetical protein
VETKLVIVVLAESAKGIGNRPIRVEDREDVAATDLKVSG